MWFRIVLLLLLGGPALADADFTARAPGRVSTDSTLLLGVDYAF
jgi:hypothetical protein